MIRSTRAQKAERLRAARRLLAGKLGMAEAAMALSRAYGLSRRQAYRYLELARAGTPAPLPIENCHGQDAGEPRAESARSCEQTRRDDKRSCQAGYCSFPGDEAPAWLSGSRYGVPSISNTNSIDCSPAGSNWLTTSWFLIGSGSSAAQR
jgi:hypothetical protein